jgi:formyltetrahydrofolate synthetase
MTPRIHSSLIAARSGRARVARKYRVVFMTEVRFRIQGHSILQSAAVRPTGHIGEGRTTATLGLV